MNAKYIEDIAARFDISQAEAERIAETVLSEPEFIAVLESTDWWTDENNAQPSVATAPTTQERDI